MMVSESSGQLGSHGRRIALLPPARITDDRITHALQLFESVLWAFQGTTRVPWTLTTPEAAHVLVLHEDDERVGVARAQGRRVVVIATDPQRVRARPAELLYPFKAVQVLTLLERLEALLQRREEPPGQVLPAQEPRDRWSLVDALVTFRAVENTQAWTVARDARTPVLWVRGDAGAYVADPMAVQALRDGSLPLSRLFLSRSAEPSGALTRRSGMELAWFAGYHASDALSPQLGPHVPYRIVRWPNLGLIKPPTRQLRLAAGLSASPASLDQVIRRGGVAPDMAIRTFNALYACGLLLKAESTPAAPAQEESVPPAMLAQRRLRRLIGAMRRHLGM